MDFVRTFVACSLPVAVVRGLHGYQRKLRERLDGSRASVKWTTPASFHVTLRFLGEVEVGVVPAIGDALSRAVESVHPFEVVMSGVGCFPNESRARVIWAGVRGRELTELYERVQEALESVGYPRETRPFHGHVTLGRLRRPADLSQALERTELYEPAVFEVAEVVLYKSTLTPNGAVYEALRRAPLYRARG